MRIFAFSLVFVSFFTYAKDGFDLEAPQLASILKQSLMSKLQTRLAKNGAEDSLGYCHANVSSIAKSAAQSYMNKYDFGRTSHKIRNTNNHPKEWMESYLEKFKKLKTGSSEAKPFVHHLVDGKRVYMEPLFVQPMCLSCHGENLSKMINQKINVLYPNDKARDFKLGDFRGFIWVKEK